MDCVCSLQELSIELFWVTVLLFCFEIDFTLTVLAQINRPFWERIHTIRDFIACPMSDEKSAYLITGRHQRVSGVMLLKLA